MRINNNIMAMNTHRQLGINNTATSKSLEKLSSGFRINRAGDDAAGLAISEKMRAQVRGLNMASKNAQDSISLIQTAEGALTESHAILQRMRELAVQSANDTNVEVDRGALQSEVDQLAQELTRIAETTEFNTQKLLDGNFEDGVFHIGANEGQNIKLSIGAMDAIALKAGQELYVSSSNLTVSQSTGATVKAKFVSVGGTIGTASETAKVAGYYVANSTGATATTELFRAMDSALTATTAITFGIDINSQSKADGAITTINNALETVSAERSKLGAYQNRLEHTIKNLDTSAENLQAAESRIRDVDMAKEMMEFTKQNILQQAATAMLAQANSLPQGVLQLLR
ncbi:flagellin N-terminal helical domain-containing protein [Clostridium sp. Cult2]|uniref:flagellin N-terminal helical domain-containing protein n=1 Tax=Clostridium sp. Cult2 TaxID=2079003 RepID=UPI001F2D3069|nr:flagellin [Clostridium sp. Cult2]MCF6465085.1 flagellin [Clostridium sp. Cult2]